MRLLYISYWRAAEPLTGSTILPHLDVARGLPGIKQIVLVTVERKGMPVVILDLPGVIHVPVFTFATGMKLFDSIFDFLFLSRRIQRAVYVRQPNLILAKGVLAGELARQISADLEVPFITESFEPHADYMVESGEWHSNGLRQLFLRKWEQRQLEKASRVLTVSHNYEEELRNKFGADNVDTLPCCVNTMAFAFSVTDREFTRKQLGIGTETTGVYVGKFGGIYYEKEAFDIFAAAFSFFSSFRLIILTPHSIPEVEQHLINAGIDIKKVTILFVRHEEVPAFLSASDFAFSTIKPAKSRKFCCPVKDGEYWANGLPILLTEGVGDDGGILEHEEGGALFNLDKNNLKVSLAKIKLILKDPDHRSRIREIARKHRSFSLVKKVYGEVLHL